MVLVPGRGRSEDVQRQRPDVLLLAELWIADQHAAVSEQLEAPMVAVGQIHSATPADPAGEP